MSEKEYLPGCIRDRIVDLKRTCGVTNKTIAEKTGLSESLLSRIESEMLAAAKALEFERAAQLRDQLLSLRGEEPVKKDVQQRRSRGPRTRKSEH